MLILGLIMKPDDLLLDHFRIDQTHQKALKKLGIVTVFDLLYHLPARYEDISNIEAVSGLVKGQDAVVFGALGGLKTRKAWKSWKPIAEGWVEDGTARIKIMWFNQPYLAKMYQNGIYVKVAGKVTGSEGKLYIANPEVERLDALPIDKHDSLFKNPNSQSERADEHGSSDDTIYPVYRESKGVTSKWFYHTVLKCFEKGVLKNLVDPIPKEILKRFNLPELQSALVWIHSPKKASDAESARKRFAFEEVFYIQIQNALNRKAVSAASTYKIEGTKKHIEEFTSRFPFPFTNAQNRAIEEILKDFSRHYAMSRLLEGDVGSGKTAVAATTAYAVATSRPPRDKKIEAVNIEKTKSANLQVSSRRGEGGEADVERYGDQDAEAPQQRNGSKFADLDFGALQVAYMAPTEILAKQHFESFIEYFKHLHIQIGLITGSGCMKFPSKTDSDKPTKISKAQLLKWVKNGEIPILIGTHALIYKSVEFKHLAYVIIDEQHRFGVNQRKALMRRKPQKGAAEPLTQKTAEQEVVPVENPEFIYQDLTYAIRGAAFAVRKALGFGHKESVYQKALAVELMKRRIAFVRETQIPVTYDGQRVGVYQPDFLVDEKVIIELKALPRISQQEQRQAWDYLRDTPYKLALLINFGSKNLEIKRIVFDTARESVLRNSASYSPERDELLRKSAHRQEVVPHLLSMTATPIPRTLALTIYGDLDITLLDEMPAGRKPVITKVVGPGQQKEMYEHVEKELKDGRQAYVVCPRIDEEAQKNAEPTQNYAETKAVIQEAERLRKEVFPKYNIGTIHGKMTPAEKDKVMKDFLDHKIDILVATSVVEVGVNVRNATNIIIEGAERFGLSQLHQLRGRVVRSNHQAYCFAVTESKSKKTRDRLKALTTAKNGFELAEFDLEFRGSGELYGQKQSGLSDLGMEAIKNLKLVEAARNEAHELVENSKDISADFPPIFEKISRLQTELHME